MRGPVQHENLRKWYLETRTHVVNECEGCTQIVDNGFCKGYVNPSAMWKDERWCPRCSTLVPAHFDKKGIEIHWVPKHIAEEKGMTVKKLNPIKKSKRRGW